MKLLTTLLFTLIMISGYSQITKVTGIATEDTTKVLTKETDDDLKLGYVANGSTIQEFSNYKLVDMLTVEDVEFYTDKIFYKVTNSDGHTFGITFTFKDRTVFFSDINGNFTEVHGKGLSFAHQY